MARWFELELDTQAPVVTWGTPTKVSPGYRFWLPYTVDEPGIISAELVPPSGPAAPLTVTGTHVTGVVPAGWSLGAVTVSALVRDEVNNEATRTVGLSVVPASSSFELELDTTAPVITWGTPTGTTPGSLFVLPYTIDEQELVSAVLVPYSGPTVALTDTGADLRAFLSTGIAEGTAHVVATVRDELLNEAEREFFFTIGVAPEPEAPEVGPLGRTPGFYGPVFVREEHRFDGVLRTRREETLIVQGLLVPFKRGQVRLGGVVSATREQEFRFSTQRQPDLLLAQALREEEELLLLLS